MRNGWAVGRARAATRRRARGLLDLAEFLQHFLGDWAGAMEQEQRFFAFARFDGDDGAFHALATCAAIDDERDSAAQFLHHGAGGGRGNAPEAVGAGCGEWLAELLVDRAEDRVGALAHRHRRQAAGHQVRYVRMLGKDQRERSRPEVGCQLVDGIGEFIRHDGHPFQISA